nr:hypothetical protein [Candidatus Sigynarchaeum springense]
MILELPLEELDFGIIGILCLIWLLTFIWRHFFRWDTRYGLKQSGKDMGAYRAFEPPFPRKDGAAIVVLERPSLDPRKRGTWLVQGLLAAGYRVLLLHSAKNAAKALQENDCTALVHHGSFTCKDEIATTITACIDANLVRGTPRAIFVNEGGSPGLKAAVDGIVMVKKTGKPLTIECSLISCDNSPGPDARLSFFHDTFVVCRPKATLRDAELQAIGCLLNWLGN